MTASSVASHSYGQMGPNLFNFEVTKSKFFFKKFPVEHVAIINHLDTGLHAYHYPGTDSILKSHRGVQLHQLLNTENENDR